MIDRDGERSSPSKPHHEAQHESARQPLKRIRGYALPDVEPCDSALHDASKLENRPFQLVLLFRDLLAQPCSFVDLNLIHQCVLPWVLQTEQSLRLRLLSVREDRSLPVDFET